MTKYWGNIYWSLIHSYSIIFNNTLQHSNSDIFLEFLFRLDYAIPCDICKGTIIKYCENEINYKSLINCKSPLDYFKWSVDLHNHINIKLDKPLYEYEIAILEYFDIDSSNNYKLKVCFYHVFWNFLLISSTFTTFQTSYAIILYNIYTLIIETTFENIFIEKYINKIKNIFDKNNTLYISNSILRAGIDIIEKNYMEDFNIDIISLNPIVYYDYSDTTSNIVTVGYSNVEYVSDISSNEDTPNFSFSNTYISVDSNELFNIPLSNITYSNILNIDSNHHTELLTVSSDKDIPDEFINTISIIDKININTWKYVFMDDSLGALNIDNTTFNHIDTFKEILLKYAYSNSDNILVTLSHWWYGFLYIPFSLDKIYSNINYITISNIQYNLYKEHNINIEYIREYEQYNFNENNIYKQIIFIHSFEFVFNKKYLIKNIFSSDYIEKLVILEFYKKDFFNDDNIPCKINKEGYYSDGILYKYLWKDIIDDISKLKNVKIVYENYELLSYYDICKIYDGLVLCSVCKDNNYLLNLKNTLELFINDWDNCPLGIFCIIINKINF